MTASHVLGAMVLGMLGIAGIWDFAAVLTSHPDSTISRIVKEWSREYPIIVFLAGLLAGHLWG
jgi:hypothetical protein